jgi:flagellar protein FlbD
MIQITRINRHTLVLNSDLIEHIESTPDTVIHLVNGQKMIVLEPAEEIVRRVVEFRRSLLRESPRIATTASVETISVEKDLA